MTDLETFTPAEADEVFKGNDLPEAPLSINIGSYYKGFYVGWTRRTADPKVKGRVAEIKEFVEILIKNGYVPSWNPETNKASLGQQTPPAQASTAPQIDLSINGADGKGGVCPVHGTPLIWKTGISGPQSKTPGKPYAFWSCPTLNADGSYCKAGTQKK